MEFSGTTGSARGAEIRENGSWSCAPASGLFFLPIKDQLTVRLEGCDQHYAMLKRNLLYTG